MIDAWLAYAVADAERRALPGLKAFLETLAQATEALRRADDELQRIEEERGSGRPAS